MIFKIMKILLFFFNWIAIFNVCNGFITYIESKYPLQGDEAFPGSPWPLPQIWTKTSYTYKIEPNYLSITTNAQNCTIIEDGLSRLSNLLNTIHKSDHKNSSYLPPLRSIHLEIDEINDCNYIYPQMDDNEFYEIAIPYRSTFDGRIRSVTIWGAIRALETLSQLVYNNHNNEMIVNATIISDWPRFSYRGVMLDSARHFLPKNTILANLDAMSYNKFNVFHWHIVDDQSFPFESKIFPELSKYGSYSPKHVYTQDDIAEIIEYARFRGIRVVPEFDTPGHTQGFGKSFPQLLTPCYGEGDDKPFTSKYGKHASAEILNPMENFTYDFMKVFFQEVRNVFQDDFVHLGMDEVYYDCWRSNPDIWKFMINNGLTDLNQVEQYYVERMIQNIEDIGFKNIVWQDPIDNGVMLANDTVVMVWKEKYRYPGSNSDNWKATVSRIVKQGYKVIVSACWYLNYISYGQDWEKYYKCDPRKFQGTETEKSMVLGGEACLWGEYVDSTNLLSRLWPRASAVAERLWSDPFQTDDIQSAKFRLDQQRCRMLQRGINAQPILNGFCGDYEWEMENEL